MSCSACSTVRVQQPVINGSMATCCLTFTLNDEALAVVVLPSFISLGNHVFLLLLNIHLKSLVFSPEAAGLSHLHIY